MEFQNIKAFIYELTWHWEDVLCTASVIGRYGWWLMADGANGDAEHEDGLRCEDW